MKEIDVERFSAARLAVLSESVSDCGVGTLAEKTLHKILKYYFEPNPECREVPFRGIIADIKNGEGITEIQTKCLDRLVPKLERLLREERVTVVYPVIYEKSIAWLDKATGAITPPRRSPRRGRPSDALPELSHLLCFIDRPGFSVRLVFFNAEEFKCLDGYGKDRKRRASRIERIPTAIVGITELKCARDYRQLLPKELSDGFTAKEFNKATALRGRRAYFALKFLISLGIIERGENVGRAFTYNIIEEKNREQTADCTSSGRSEL